MGVIVPVRGRMRAGTTTGPIWPRLHAPLPRASQHPQDCMPPGANG